MTDLIRQRQIPCRALNEDFLEHSSLNPMMRSSNTALGGYSAGLHAPDNATQSSWPRTAAARLAFRTRPACAGCYRGNARGGKKEEHHETQY